ncbi:MAG: adenylyltransferase/cytidyltransferase family protein [bacterium]
MKTIAISEYFDLIHKGHIEYIKLAKQLGDKLIVILNNDEQAVLKKGRPFMLLEDRKAIPESIKYIDEVFVSIDKDRSVKKSLESIKPHIFAVGADRFAYEIPEAETCKRLGIQIVDGLGTKIQSSSNIISSN